jgi:integrase/recombinase XerC
MREITDADRRIIRLHVDHCDLTLAASSKEDRRAVLDRYARAIPTELLGASASVVSDWQAGLLRQRGPRGQALSRNTLGTYTMHVRQFYRWAFDVGHIDVDPAARLSKVKRPKGLPRPVPEADLQTALLCAPRQVRVWLLLGAFMGLRAMEIARGRRHLIHDVGGRLLYSGIGKGAKPFRLTVPKEVEPDLRACFTADDLLWRTQTGSATSDEYVSRTVSAYFKALGMPYTLHQLRHSFGSAAYAETRDLLLTQKLMRHSSPATTQGYVEIGGNAGVKAMDRVASRALGERKQRRVVPPPVIETGEAA